MKSQDDSKCSGGDIENARFGPTKPPDKTVSYVPKQQKKTPPVLPLPAKYEDVYVIVVARHQGMVEKVAALENCPGFPFSIPKYNLSEGRQSLECRTLVLPNSDFGRTAAQRRYNAVGTLMQWKRVHVRMQCLEATSQNARSGLIADLPHRNTNPCEMWLLSSTMMSILQRKY